MHRCVASFRYQCSGSPVSFTRAFNFSAGCTSCLSLPSRRFVGQAAADREGDIVVVCGGSRGIGLEMCRQMLLGSNAAKVAPVKAVVALGRGALESKGLDALKSELQERGLGRERLLQLRCDVSDEKSLMNCKQRIQKELGYVDVVINTAGVLSDLSGRIPKRDMPEKTVAKVSLQTLEFQFGVNAFGPILLAKTFIPLLKRSSLRKVGRVPVFASLSARVGSISDNKIGGWYSYRASKAAQNALLKCTAIEMGFSSRNPIVLMLHPGTVDTDLSVPFQRQVTWKLFSLEQGARQLLEVIYNAERKDNGRFLDWQGKDIPW